MKTQLEKHQNQIRHVLVSGGTHGNEYTGAFLARHWLVDPTPVTRGGFSTHVLFSHPEAFKVCKRYIDRDLNRSFHPSEEIAQSGLMELTRAQEIQEWLRLKCEGNYPDVIFDLHSTTANMGLSLVLTNREPFNLLLLSYLNSRFAGINAYIWEEGSSQPGFLNSLSKNGFAIEVGPVANGVLNAEWVQKTSFLVNACLDFIGLWNCKDQSLSALSKCVTVFTYCGHVDYPRSADGLPAAMIHPDLQDKDFQPLKKGEPIFLGFGGDVSFWEGETVYPVFINEAAYYEKGIAFTVTQKLNLEIY